MEGRRRREEGRNEKGEMHFALCGTFFEGKLLHAS
jgi:hypothetical protein